MFECIHLSDISRELAFCFSKHDEREKLSPPARFFFSIYAFSVLLKMWFPCCWSIPSHTLTSLFHPFLSLFFLIKYHNFWFGFLETTISTPPHVGVFSSSKSTSDLTLFHSDWNGAPGSGISSHQGLMNGYEELRFLKIPSGHRCFLFRRPGCILMRTNRFSSVSVWMYVCVGGERAPFLQGCFRRVC